MFDRDTKELLVGFSTISYFCPCAHIPAASSRELVPELTRSPDVKLN
jgi:hypothetical protein